MLAITLAAGSGTRMGILTSNKPKTLIEFQGETLLARQRRLFKEFSFKHYVIGGYKHESIEIEPSSLLVNHQFNETNMVYSLFCARQLLESCIDHQDVIISYGDIIYQKSVLHQLTDAKMGDIQVCSDKNFLSYWSIRMENPLNDLETFFVSENGYISEIGLKPQCLSKIMGQYIGLFKISRRYIKKLIKIYDELEHQNIRPEKISMTDFIQILIQNECKAYPVYINGGWLEFDTRQDIDVYSKLNDSEHLKKFYDYRN